MIQAILLGVVLVQGQLPRDSVRSRLYVQAELTWYGTGDQQSLNNRHVRLEAIRRLGFGGTRLPVEWSRIERVRGQPDWRRLDSTVAELVKDNLAFYGVIAYSPPWAVPDSLRGKPRSEAHRPVVNGSSSKGDAAFAAFAAAAARRYRGHINRWEIWNEENYPPFWIHVVDGVNQGVDPEDYADLYRAARDSIMGANPDAQVSIGGLASVNGVARPISDPLNPKRDLIPLTPDQFLRGLKRANLRPAVVAIHPYSTVAPDVRVASLGTTVFPGLVVDSVLETLRALGWSDSPVWVTEWGVNVTPGMSQADVTSWLVRGLRYLLCTPNVQLVTLHALTDDNQVEHFGLLKANGESSMVGDALLSALKSWEGCER